MSDLLTAAIEPTEVTERSEQTEQTEQSEKSNQIKQEDSPESAQVGDATDASAVATNSALSGTNDESVGVLAECVEEVAGNEKVEVFQEEASDMVLDEVYSPTKEDCHEVHDDTDTAHLHETHEEEKPGYADGGEGSGDAAANASGGQKKKRLCRYPGCVRVIKSQGHCQRHGAKAKRCKVDGCDKQAQGTHDGMCKRHWKSINFPEISQKNEALPPPPEGESVYDSVLPLSIAYRPNSVAKQKKDKEEESKKVDPLDPPPAPAGENVMPLVAFFREGVNKKPGWHRNAERRARGMYPVTSLSSQLEPWERQLALVEILLLSGGTPYANFKDMAHGWGREKGFHHVLANSVCERRGEVERKRRSDAGRTLTQDQKEAFRQKLKKTRLAGKESHSRGKKRESLSLVSNVEEPTMEDSGSQVDPSVYDLPTGEDSAPDMVFDGVSSEPSRATAENGGMDPTEV